jgi:5'-3' exonuclease
MNRYLLIDGPNLTHAAQGAKKLTVGETEVQAIYTFLRIMRSLMGTYGMMKPIVLWDGASWRKMLFPEYKEGREKNHTPAYQKAQAEKDSAKKQMPAIKKALTLIGVDQVRASNMEADDLAAILADRYVARGDKVMLISGDKDWIQLVGPGISWFDPIKDRKIRKIEDVKEHLGYELADFSQFVEMKALMGDSGDSVPGVGGIGDKGAQEFFRAYTSWANFSNMALDGSLDINLVGPKFRKALQSLADDEGKRIAFARNMKLVDLRTKERPDPINLSITRGEADKGRFEEFCRRLVFQSILKDLDTWLSVFDAFRPPWEDAA